MAYPHPSMERIFVYGFPGLYGGAGTELHHQIIAWQHLGLKVHLIPTNEGFPREPLFEEMIRRGVKVHLPHDFRVLEPEDAILGFCNAEFLAMLPEIIQRTRRTVFLNCMTWLFDKEKECMARGEIGMFLYQNENVRQKHMPELRALNPDAEARFLTFRPYFENSLFPYVEERSQEHFGCGRISRQDADKFAANTLHIYEYFVSPKWKRGLFLGFDQRSEVNTRNIETVYEYDVVRGGLTKMIGDKGTGDALNLTTDYEIDDLGRRILAKGPEHTIDLNGTATLVRSARWTYYKDSDDEVWNFGGYIKVSDGSKQAVGPVSIERSYETPTDTTTMSGWRQASSIDVALTGTGIPAKTATFARSTWVRWSAAFFDKAGELMQSRLYWVIPSSGDGAVSTNYGKTLYGYDAGGRAIKVVQPGGTITNAVYNAMGWLLNTSIGTDDGSPGNMVLVQENQYDGGTQGVGNLTQVTLHPTASSGSDRVTTFRYDWRLRLEETEATVEADGGGTNTLITKRAYDNRSNITSLSEFKTNTSSANLIGQRKFYFDTRNRRYRVEVYAVNSSGSSSTPQTSNTYFGSCGRALREEPAGSSTFTVTTFDRVSRLEKTYVGYVPSGTSQPTDPTDISTSVIMEQSANAYDAASNLISTLTRSRQDDATGAGVLQDPSTQPKARLAYTAYYPDSLGRQQAVAAYGTNGGSSWTRSATIPTRSDTVLVSSNGYDSAGNTVLTSDPQATLTSFTYDKADRLTIQIENAPASSSSSSSSSSGGSVPSYRTTGYEYTDDSLLKKLKCDDSSTGQQVTEWVYGVDTGKGSALASNVLVYQKIYPDSTGSTDRVTYNYNRLGQATELKDQAGTVHSYFYDKLGRFLTDLATLAAGSSLDNSIGKIEVGYDVRGLRSRVTSSGPAGYAGSSSSSSSGVTSIVNEVKWAYNDFRQPVTEYQEVAGAVNTSTSRKLQYAYASGSANTVRLTSLTLPSGQVVNYDYGTASGQNDKLSRVETIKDGSTTITSYKYLGTRSFVGVDYTVPGVSLSYDGSATKFSGLDNFNRVVDLRWKAGSVNKVQAKYGYSRASKRTWRKDQQAHDDGQVTQDQMFWYDGLYQVTNAQRGDLTPGSGPPYTGIAPATRQQNEIFGYDQMGNWLSYYSQSPALSQTRAHNKANEITSITNPTSVIQPAYDAVGNMTTLPQPADWTAKFTAKWDAWNRLIELKDGAGAVVAAYAYDGLFRRTTKTISGTTRKFYYTSAWQVAEEYVGTATDPHKRYFWGLRNINDLIRRQRYSSGTTLHDDLYALVDTMNVVGLVDASGAVEQRFGYSTFGTPIWLTSAWASSTNTKEWNVLFHGHYLDGESGLYQMRFRYYHPTVGRWVSRDPIGERGGLNLYGMVGNDGVNWIDALGKSPWSWPLKKWIEGKAKSPLTKPSGLGGPYLDPHRKLKESKRGIKCWACSKGRVIALIKKSDYSPGPEWVPVGHDYTCTYGTTLGGYSDEISAHEAVLDINTISIECGSGCPATDKPLSRVPRSFPFDGITTPTLPRAN